MGCGQSKIGIIYPRKSKSKGGSKRSGKFVNLRVFRLRKKKSSHKNKQRVDPDSDEEAEEADPVPVQDVAEPEPEEPEEPDDPEKTNLTGNRHILPAGGPLLAQTEISSSQVEFFRMLDEKIESGPDYDSTNEEEIARERARDQALLKEWETASNNSSLTRSAPTTPAHRKLPAKPTNVPSSLPQYYHHPHVNGDLYYQQQQQQQQQQQYQYQQHQQHQQQSYFQHHVQQQYQPPPPHLHRGQYVMPPPPPQMTRVAPVMMRTYPMMPQQPSTAIVQYRQSRGAYTELA